MRGSVAIVLAATVLLVGCSGEESGEEARLEGVERVQPVRIDEADVRDAPLPQHPVVVDRPADDTLVVAYMGQLSCADEPWRQQPAGVTASFGPERLTLTIDPVAAGCEDGDEEPFLGGVEVVLPEPVGDRTIETWYAR